MKDRRAEAIAAALTWVKTNKGIEADAADCSAAEVPFFLSKPAESYSPATRTHQPGHAYYVTINVENPPPARVRVYASLSWGQFEVEDESFTVLR